MNVPLDNLYDWMSSISRDILIYRFFPHGSKNLGDLSRIGGWQNDMSTSQKLYHIPMICHDQELLDFDRYQLSGSALKELCLSKWPNRVVYQCLKPNVDFWWDYKAQMNLAAVIAGSIADKTILLHSEKRSRQVSLYEEHDFIPAYWWSHAMIARDWYRYAQYDPYLQHDSKTFRYDFNIYSRAWTGTREYRLVFLDRMLHLGLDKSSRITFNENDGYHWKQHVFTNERFSVQHDLSLLASNSVTSCSSATYDWLHYRDCAIDVVLETVFDDERLHLTEKILRPIACGKPFILASSHGALKYLRDYGFQTFQGIIDESYDDIVDPIQRINAILSVMDGISKKSLEEKSKLFASMQSVCEYNKQYFFSEKFSNGIQKELWDNILAARKIIKEKFYQGRVWLSEINERARARHSPNYGAVELEKAIAFCRQQQRQYLITQPVQSDPGSFAL